MMVDDINEDDVVALENMLKAHPGDVELKFNVTDAVENMNVTLQSKYVRVSVKKELISFIKAKPNLSYKIN
jgi:hypothetical protein